MTSRLPTFWLWFYRGSGGVPGYARVVNRWLIFHCVAGLGAAALVEVNVEEIAKGGLLPLMAILVGLTFSWAGNAHGVMQSSEICERVSRNRGGIADYVFTFQLCVLINVVTICAWTIPMLKVPYLLPALMPQRFFDGFALAFLFSLVSLAIRTGWHAVLGANMLLLMRVSLMEKSGRGRGEQPLSSVDRRSLSVLRKRSR